MNEEEVKEIYIANTKPKDNSLKSCLENLSEEALDDLILYTADLDDCDNFDSKNDKVEFLKDYIINNFSDEICTISDEEVEELEKIAKNKKTNEFLVNLIELGFLFGYYNNQKIEYIFPDELLEKYLTLDIDKMRYQNKIEKIKVIIDTSLLINGVVLVDNLINYLNENDLKVRKKEIDKLIIDKGLTIINSKYYTEYTLENMRIVDEKVESLNSNLENTFLNYEDSIIYIKFLLSMYHKLELIKNKKTLNELFYLLISKPFEEFKKALNEKYNLKKKTIDEIISFIEPDYENIKTWYLNGHSLNEVKIKEICENIYLDKEPKKKTVIDCLNCLSKDSFAKLTKYYNLSNPSKDELYNHIVKNFMNEKDEDLQFFDIIANGGPEIFNLEFKMKPSYFEKGYIYAYKENGEITYIVPNEFYIYEEDEDDYENLIFCYVLINGLIKIDKLLEILNKYHGLNITKEELLDEFLDECFSIINDEYIGLFDFKEAEMSIISGMKKDSDNFKIIDNNFKNEFVDFFEKLQHIVENEKESGMLTTVTIFSICMNMYDDFTFESMCKDFKVPKATVEKIEKLVKEYKNNLPLWIYNGYSINEYNKIKKKKIGRNEPCPCGSGKKYKHCCGK